MAEDQGTGNKGRCVQRCKEWCKEWCQVNYFSCMDPRKVNRTQDKVKGTGK
jgi:hypothetical protein